MLAKDIGFYDKYKSADIINYGGSLPLFLFVNDHWSQLYDSIKYASTETINHIYDKDTSKTLLNFVVEFQCSKCIAAILNRNDIVFTTNPETGDNILLEAIKNTSEDYTDIAIGLIAFLSNIDGKHLKFMNEKTGETPLFAAASRKNYKLIRKLTLYGVDVNAVNKLGFTILHYAVAEDEETRDIEYIKRLMSIRSINPNVADPDGDSPFMLALKDHRSTPSFINELDALGLNKEFINKQTKETALIVSLRQNIENSIDKYLFSYKYVTQVSNNGDSALSIAKKKSAQLESYLLNWLNNNKLEETFLQK